MAVKFRASPKGEVQLVRGDTQLLRKRPVPGEKVKDVCRIVLGEKEVKHFRDKGKWYELRVEDFYGGEMCTLALGYTATDPATLETAAEVAEAEEGADPPPSTSNLPLRAHEVPGSYVFGYTRSIYWSGERIQVAEYAALDTLTPARIFTIGVLLTEDNKFEVYVNRLIHFSFDPAEKGLPPLPSGQPMWLVVDVLGGLAKATLLGDSQPPSEEDIIRAREAAEARKALRGDDGAKKNQQGDAAPGGEDGEAPAEGGEAAAEAPAAEA